MKQVIVNADDFGLSLGTNRAIQQLFHTGAITSATLMSNGPAFEDAVDSILTAGQKWAVGLHVNLSQFSPVGDGAGLGALLDNNGQFKSRNAIAKAWVTGRVNESALQAEIRAQFQACISKGITPDHFDSHQHAHAIPVVCKAINKVAVEVGVPVRKLNPYIKSGTWKRILKAKFLNYISKKNGYEANSERSKEITLASIFSTNLSPSVKAYSELLAACLGPIIELMVHPSNIDAEHKSLTSISDISLADYQALSSAEWKEFQRNSPYKFVNYADVS